MEIGVVVHGPNIIDSGYALYILDILSNFGNIHCRLGGTMGRTAVIDASLENVIDISEKLLPSQSLKKYKDDDLDCIFLLNYGKSSTTGQVFGYKVFHHYIEGLSDDLTPVIQIERPGEEDGSVIVWDGNETQLTINDEARSEYKVLTADEFANQLALGLELNIVSPEEIRLKHFSNETPTLEGKVVRPVHGVSPGENILVNGMVIGKSCSENLTLVATDGIISEIIGGDIKPHGVSKLGKIDLNTAIIKTGLLRRTDDVKPRVINHESDLNVLRVAYLDHAAEDIYKLKNMDLVVTIGDDTTLVASDILYRFDVPIIGITDGDLDKVVEHGFVKKDSHIIQVDSGFDDIVGAKIFEEIFNSNEILEIVYPQSENKDDFKKNRFNHIFEAIKQIVNNINCGFNINN
jgi:hypothetical protein